MNIEQLKGWFERLVDCDAAVDDNNKFYGAKVPSAMIEELGALLSEPVPAKEVPEGWADEWHKNVMVMWVCVRKHDSSMPDDQLDFMRDFLLSAAPKPESKP